MRVKINDCFDGMDYIELILSLEEIESIFPLGITQEYLQGFKNLPLNVCIRPETEQEKMEREYLIIEEEQLILDEQALIKQFNKE